MTTDTKSAMTTDTNAPELTPAQMSAMLATMQAQLAKQQAHIAEQDATLSRLRPKTDAELAALDRERRMPAPDGGPRVDAPDPLIRQVERIPTVTVRRLVKAGPTDDGITTINASDFDPAKHERLDAPAAAPKAATPRTKSNAAPQTRDQLLTLSLAALSAHPEAKALASLPDGKEAIVDAILAARA